MNATDDWKDDWARALVFIRDAHEWKSQRDEARALAESYRNKYVEAFFGKSGYKCHTLPWEADK